MNFRLLCKLLGIIAMLIGAMMVFSLPWAFPGLGHRTAIEATTDQAFERGGFWALLASIVICFSVAGALRWFGRTADGHLYRKEAMAVVGLSWVLATVLGALPFYFAEVYRCASVRLLGQDQPPLVYTFGRPLGQQWRVMPRLQPAEYRAVEALLAAGARGLDGPELDLQARDPLDTSHAAIAAVDAIEQLARRDAHWNAALLMPEDAGPHDRSGHYRIRWVRMSFVDALFESQSGFSTTGATVISDLEDPVMVPHCILFWRSSTHFLGGLGIIVLFVAILGQGSAGKVLMRAEMPGPSKEGSQTRMQHTAWLFAAIYCGLTSLLICLLVALGLSWFDAICHAFGTMATGGFSTYNASLGHFDSAAIEYVVIVFMILAGSNFTLLYFMLVGQPRRLLADIEWRTYISVIFAVTSLVVLFGHFYGDFLAAGQAPVPFLRHLADSVRYGLFQVVSIMTTTGYGTHDFDNWNSFGRGVLFLLMFVGGCAGSTGGGMKVIRHILFLKVLALEIEQAFHPTVVRPLRLAGQPVDDPGLRKNILVYFSLILVIFVFSWMFLVTVEPDTTWGGSPEHKLIDTASGIAATLNNIGPGLGTVGATQNYTHFTPLAKVLFTWLMMIGRLEIFVILVLFVPSFWRSH